MNACEPSDLSPFGGRIPATCDIGRPNYSSDRNFAGIGEVAVLRGRFEPLVARGFCDVYDRDRQRNVFCDPDGPSTRAKSSSSSSPGHVAPTIAASDWAPYESSATFLIHVALDGRLSSSSHGGDCPVLETVFIFSLTPDERMSCLSQQYTSVIPNGGWVTHISDSGEMPLENEKGYKREGTMPVIIFSSIVPAMVLVIVALFCRYCLPLYNDPRRRLGRRGVGRRGGDVGGGRGWGEEEAVVSRIPMLTATNAVGTSSASPSYPSTMYFSIHGQQNHFVRIAGTSINGHSRSLPPLHPPSSDVDGTMKWHNESVVVIAGPNPKDLPWLGDFIDQRESS
ncbi:hypothetical protein CBR_g6709 [Chara braunii]|uniref:Uncharacterized protein n=1 Tax=Chara braunii TaxID=69332 RepID=A0A388KKU9_CHABU|nr:hypothetical protein CBR_g6709 [Chara braunii]|eukprot:GBG70583.1 hypothetical protein CBR_g6709 [Chara braunii]